MNEHTEQPSSETPDLEGDLLPERVLARRWSKSLRTLQRWRAAGEGPPYLRIGSSIFYRAPDIRAFEVSCRQDPSAER